MWKGIVSKFNALTGRKYNKLKLKNRLLYIKMDGWNEHLEQNAQDDDDVIFEEASHLAALV
ncbi:hypothetical protein L195_g049948, partial [Trifolium pratense]